LLAWSGTPNRTSRTFRLSSIAASIQLDDSWFHIPTAEYSMRVRHVRSRPATSLTHFELNVIAVIVHGRAEIISPGAPEFEELEIPEREKWWHALRAKGQGVLLRIEPERMFAWAKDPSQFSGV